MPAYTSQGTFASADEAARKTKAITAFVRDKDSRFKVVLMHPMHVPVPKVARQDERK
jgi:hypothetical protein